MKLVLIYGVKTSDYCWLRSSFYPVKRIADHCQKQKIEFVLFLPQDFEQIVESLLTSTEVQSQNQLAGLFCGSTFLLRGEIAPGVYAVLKKVQALANGKSLNFKYTPDLGAKLIADDKKLMYQFFARHNLPFAPSVFFNVSSVNSAKKISPSENCKLFENLSQTLNTPFVAKPRFGSQGRGISLIENEKDLAKYLAQNTCGELIFQQFIKCGDGFSSDLRFFVCGGTVLACALRKSRHQLLSNFHAGGQMQIISSPKDLAQNGIGGVTGQHLAQMLQTAINAVQNAGLLYGSADFLILQNSRPLKYFLCEINASPGFEGIENAVTSENDENGKIEIVPKLISAVLNLR